MTVLENTGTALKSGSIKIDRLFAFFSEVTFLETYGYLKQLYFVGCMENGINYYGFDTGSTSSSNAGHCSEACKESSVCSFWTFNKNTKTCLFKSSDEDKRTNSHAISGPKECAGIPKIH